MTRLATIFLITSLIAACQETGPTVATEDPQYAKGGVPGPPPDKPDEGRTAQVEMCAMSSVIDDIRAIEEEPNAEGPTITSMGRDCGCSHPWPEYCPEGVLTYSTAGPMFEWRFQGTGFVPVSHGYVLITTPDPWPGRGLICLEGDETQGVRANRGGNIRFSGSRDLGMHLTDARIWIVRSAWVDCDANGFRSRLNPDDSPQPRLTNDHNGDGLPDATDSCGPPFGSLPWYCPDASRADDWLFETTAIRYIDTDLE